MSACIKCGRPLFDDDLTCPYCNTVQNSSDFFEMTVFDEPDRQEGVLEEQAAVSKTLSEEPVMSADEVPPAPEASASEKSEESLVTETVAENGEASEFGTMQYRAVPVEGRNTETEPVLPPFETKTPQKPVEGNTYEESASAPSGNAGEAFTASGRIPSVSGGSYQSAAKETSGVNSTLALISGILFSVYALYRLILLIRLQSFSFVTLLMFAASVLIAAGAFVLMSGKNMYQVSLAGFAALCFAPVLDMINYLSYIIRYGNYMTGGQIFFSVFNMLVTFLIAAAAAVLLLGFFEETVRIDTEKMWFVPGAAGLFAVLFRIVQFMVFHYFLFGELFMTALFAGGLFAFFLSLSDAGADAPSAAGLQRAKKAPSRGQTSPKAAGGSQSGGLFMPEYLDRESMDRLRKLKALYDQDVLSEEEYARMKAELLNL